MAGKPVPIRPDEEAADAQPPLSRTERARLMSRSLWHRFLQRIGWELPPLPQQPAVISRPRLTRILFAQMDAGGLPAAYRNLFALVPVETPDELVDREEPLEGLKRALRWWEGGNSASVLMLGIVGSGRRSVLNCAVAAEARQAPMLRCALTQRWRMPADVHGFFRQALGIAAGGDVTAALRAQRRILLVERIERSYLRTPGGFAALEEFLNLMEATSGVVFWVIPLGELPRRLLQAELRFSRYFSHQIYLGAVTPATLQAAILRRHRLSGLKLEFDPAVVKHRRLRWLTHQTSPEEAFFELLHRQSEGIFGAGFVLWLQSIRTLDGDTLRLRLPPAPNYQPLRQLVTRDDLYLLKASAQHGGITVEEAAELFALPPGTCQRRLGRMRELQIMDQLQDGRFGMRPMAIGFMRDLLDYHNMMD